MNFHIFFVRWRFYLVRKEICQFHGYINWMMNILREYILNQIILFKPNLFVQNTPKIALKKNPHEKAKVNPFECDLIIKEDSIKLK